MNKSALRRNVNEAKVKLIEISSNKPQSNFFMKLTKKRHNPNPKLKSLRVDKNNTNKKVLTKLNRKHFNRSKTYLVHNKKQLLDSEVNNSKQLPKIRSSKKRSSQKPLKALEVHQRNFKMNKILKFNCLKKMNSRRMANRTLNFNSKSRAENFVETNQNEKSVLNSDIKKNRSNVKTKSFSIKRNRRMRSLPRDPNKQSIRIKLSEFLKVIQKNNKKKKKPLSRLIKFLNNLENLPIFKIRDLSSKFDVLETLGSGMSATVKLVRGRYSREKLVAKIIKLSQLSSEKMLKNVQVFNLL